MKFSFRLETLLRQRKVERDVAQREYAEAQAQLRAQLALIQQMYDAIDNARAEAESIQQRGGACVGELETREAFVVGQKIRIAGARDKARELMAIEEEKHDILIEKMQAFKALEKMREKKKQEFELERKRKSAKKVDDLVTMSFGKEKW